MAGELLDLSSESAVIPACDDLPCLGFWPERFWFPVSRQLASDLRFAILPIILVASVDIELGSRRVIALARFGGGGIKGGVIFFKGGVGGFFFIRGGRKGGGVEIVTGSVTSDAL